MTFSQTSDRHCHFGENRAAKGRRKRRWGWGGERGEGAISGRGRWEAGGGGRDTVVVEEGGFPEPRFDADEDAGKVDQLKTQPPNLKKFRNCVNREVGLGCQSVMPYPILPSVPNKPYGFCGRKAQRKKQVKRCQGAGCGSVDSA